MLHGGICAENKAGSRRGRCYEDAFELKEKQAKSAGIRAFKIFFYHLFITCCLFGPTESYSSSFVFRLCCSFDSIFNYGSGLIVVFWLLCNPNPAVDQRKCGLIPNFIKLPTRSKGLYLSSTTFVYNDSKFALYIFC